MLSVTRDGEPSVRLPSTFLAYDSTRPYVDTMPRLAEELRSVGVEVATWEDPLEPGPIWGGPNGIRSSIDRAGLFLGEMTRGNGNVLFELGYAIGAGKHAFGLFDRSNTNAQRLVVLEDQAQIQYERRTEIQEYLQGVTLDAPPLIAQIDISEIRERQNGLFFLPSRAATDLGSAVLAACRDSMFRVATMDTNESEFLKLTSTVQALAESRVFVGILVREEVRQANASNAHTMLIAGIAAGLGKRYVLVAEENGKRYLDLGENLIWIRNEQSAASQLANWLKAVAKAEWENLARSSEVRPRDETSNLLHALSLGGPDARMDLALPEYFIQTPEYRQARNGDRNFFVGAKGSGKSAAYETLYSEFSRHSQDVLVAINPSEFEFPHLARIFDEVPYAHASYVYSSFWRFIFITEIVRAIREGFFDELLIDSASSSSRSVRGRTRRSEPKSPSYGEVLVNWIDENSDLLSLEFASRVTRVLDRVSGVEGSESERREKYEQLLQVARLYDIEQHIAAFASSRTIRLLIDDLDRNWDPGYESSLRLISSLLTAVQDLFSNLRPSLVPTVFIRADVDEQIRPVDTERGRRGLVTLQWTPALIEQLIGRRLAVRSGVSDANDRELWDLFFPERVEDERTSEYVTLRSLARPRHAIMLCQEAINAAQRAGRSEVTEDDVIVATAVTSETLLAEIEAEYRFRYPGVVQVALKLFGGQPFEATASDLHARFQDASQALEAGWIGECIAEPERLIEILYTVALVGVGAGDGQRVFVNDRPWSTASQMLRGDYRVVLHPAFRSYVLATDP